VIEFISGGGPRLLGVEEEPVDGSEDFTWSKVHCRVHGVRPAYFVCSHLEGPEDIAYFDQAGINRVGVLCCEIPFDQHTIEQFFIYCLGCLREAAILPAA
jgi:hypothetical protein